MVAIRVCTLTLMLVSAKIDYHLAPICLISIAICVPCFSVFPNNHRGEYIMNIRPEKMLHIMVSTRCSFPPL